MPPVLVSRPPPRGGARGANPRGDSGVHVSASHEVLPQFREYERCSTTVIDAYLSPARPLSRPARGDGDRARAPGAARDAVLGRGRARGRGGAGGRVERSVGARGRGGRRRAARAHLRRGDALGIDMGGTSCDVCVVDDGRVRRTDSREIEGRVLQLPMVDVHTVGAAGGRSGGGTPEAPLRWGRTGAEPDRRATGEEERADGHRRKPGARLPRG